MKRRFIFALISTVCLAFFLSGCGPAPIIVVNPQNGPILVTPGLVRTHRLRGEVKLVPEGSTALVTDSNGSTLSFNTSELVPGNVYTTWWMIINEPEKCESSPCSIGDLLGRADIVKSEIAYGTGQIADEQGRATFTATIHRGEVPGAWYGNGYPNPRKAEVHVALHDHGPLIEELREEMLTTFRAGCTDESLPQTFPPISYTDGTPGPNDCIHYQFTLFQQ